MLLDLHAHHDSVMFPNWTLLDALVAAAGLVETYFKPMGARVYGDAALPEGERLATTLARWIVSSRTTEFNARDVRRTVRLPGLRDATAMESATTLLTEARWLLPAGSRLGGSAGRKTLDFSVNPALWEALK